MNIADFDYHLPDDRIAQEPARPRDSSRLLVLDRARRETTHRAFRDVVDYCGPNDLVVLNDTRVIRARLRGRRHPGGGRADVLLLVDEGGGVWDALVSPGRRLGPGREIVFGDGELRAAIIERTPSGGRRLRFSGEVDVGAALERFGEVPLPPYIHQPLREESDYQTVFAQMPGASAAPTAGLHFTPDMVEAVRARVSAVVPLTLHIGVSTFRPIRVERIEDHDMHVEHYSIPEATAQAVSEAKAKGGRVLAVGTSTLRALEAAADGSGRVRAGAAATDLFITPGYRFRVAGALLTNFHLPRSTLLVLLCAFAGRELVSTAYREAVEHGYRFLSFGDAMLVI